VSQLSRRHSSPGSAAPRTPRILHRAVPREKRPPASMDGPRTVPASAVTVDGPYEDRAVSACLEDHRKAGEALSCPGGDDGRARTKSEAGMSEITLGTATADNWDEIHEMFSAAL